jgi:flagellar biogenesis protein FliO
VVQKNVKIVALIAAAVITLAAPLVSRCIGTKEQAPEAEQIQPLLKKDPNFTFGTDQQIDTSRMYWKLLTAVGMVLVLGAAALYVSKKLGTKIPMYRGSGREMQIAETLYLGSRKAVHLIKIGDERILIATTPTTVTGIAKFDNPDKSGQASPASQGNG